MDFIKKRRTFIINIYFFILLGSISNNLGKDLIKNIPRNLENEHDNYIVLYYNSDCSYQYGFKNPYRNDIAYLIKKEKSNSKISNTEKINIYKEFGIEIYLNKSIKKLDHFFDAKYDGNMKYLVSVDFTNFNTSNVITMSYMFNGCSSLKSINLYNFDTSKVITMYFMFYNCSSLKSLDLSNFDTSQVTYMSYMFYNCSSLKSLDLSNFDTSKVTSMSYMFFGCSSLESIDLSNFDTFKVTDMFYMFYGCSSLKSLDLSNFDTSKVTSMSSMFFGCSSLESIDLSNFDMINCNSYFNMFSNIDIIKYINLYNVKNDKNIFNQVNNIIFVCQKDNIILNSKVYNCCNSNFEVYDCINSSTSDNNNSSDKISDKIIIGIIIGGIIFLSIIIILIIYIYKKKKNSYLVQNNIISTFNDESNMLHEHEPMTEKRNPMIFIFETTSQTKVRILIDSDKTIDELIKFYFDEIKRPDLYGEQSIWFLINGKSIIPPYPKETLEKLLNKINNYKTVKIIVNDSEEKIK